jgi:bromodomain-containing factor 1
MASKLEEQYEKALRTLPSDAPPVAAASSPAGGPSSRRQSISHTPTIRRDAESSRPKRDIHPPPSKDIDYNSPGSLRKPKRRSDPQIQWAARTIGQLEKTQKYFDIVSPFLYSVQDIIAAIPTYTQVIKKPIDFLMIKQRLEDNVYDDVAQIDADMRLMCNNARTFNPPGDAVHNAANALLQIWTEKWRTLPPKQELREASEEVVADEYDSEDEDKDVARLREAKSERAQLDREIAELERKIQNKPAKQRKPPKAPKTKAAAPRKYSTTSKASPGGPSANGAPKKQRKPKPEVVYRDDDESDEEVQSLTIQQQQELAAKITTADADILGQAVAIIQSTTNISGDQEIELDMNSLPSATVIKLYNLVCKGGRKRGKKAKPQPRKSGFGGAPGRKHLNEQEEADRIRKMEAQLQAFDSRGPAQSFEEESSSEEESSDEE